MRLGPPSLIPRAARVMRMLPLAALLVSLIASPASACSIVSRFWVRYENVPAMVLQALPDSVYMGLFGSECCRAWTTWRSGCAKRPPRRGGAAPER